MAHAHVDTDGFRFRGLDMARTDAFSDVVFGFALTLLIVSLEVPKTFAEPHQGLLGFLPFGVCFYFLMSIWYQHYKFFRRWSRKKVAAVRERLALDQNSPEIAPSHEVPEAIADIASP